MIIGVPKEIKNQEYRVGMTPGSVRECIEHGHKVVVQSTAGIGIGCSDDAYQAVGASISPSAEDLFNQAEMIVKVKEPQKSECKMLREGQILFTYLHLAPDEEQVDMLLDSGCTAIAYETITDSLGNLPLLAPMSAIAGRMAIHVAAYSLHKNSGGSGILFGGVPGTQPAKVLIVGGGVVGTNAAQMGIGLGSDVTVIDKNMSRLRYLDEIFGSRLKTCYATLDSIEEFAVGSFVGAGYQMRMMRGNLLDVLKMQFIETARAKGLKESKIVWKHGVPNALHPIIMNQGRSVSYLIEGEIEVAIVLAIPTVGPLVLSSVSSMDIYVASSIFMILSLVLVIGNFVADCFLALLDPRIRDMAGGAA